MAVDLRVSSRKACRSWLEGRLLEMEEEGLLDVTREKHPSHYHVAVFPSPFMAYAEARSPDAGSADARPEPVNATAALPIVKSAFVPVPAAEQPEHRQLDGPILAFAVWSVLAGAYLLRRRGAKLPR
jgi:hypothetical protein